MDWRDRIVMDPEVAAGKPVVRGTRIAVSLIVRLLAEGWSEVELLESYPSLSREDIQACLAYASEVLEGELVFPLKAS